MDSDVRAADYVNPREAFGRLPGENRFLLESQLHIGDIGRWSFMGSNPSMTVKSRGDTVWIGGNEVDELEGNPVRILQKLLRERRRETPKDIPFAGGAVGYFGYDLYPQLIDVPAHENIDVDVPDMYFGFYDSVLAFDHQNEKAYLAGDSDSGALLEEAVDSITDGAASEEFCVRDFCPNFSKKQYLGAVESVREYIREGDIYQANLSQRFKAGFTGSGWGLYKRIAEANPAPFSAYLDFPGFKVLSSSPERFLKKTGRLVETRPIKGTRPRGATPNEDADLAKELAASVKDAAEHVMIVDLERNDLGRVCRYGSVRVSRMMEVESYPGVHHLVSTVEGGLRDGLDACDCILECFPGGSITGAPKARSMQIIRGLEPNARGVYTGSVGYLGFDGDADLNIAIRTILVKDEALYLSLGGGIVWDSNPEREYQETLDKGSKFFEALDNG